jgi:hypothetical protein
MTLHASLSFSVNLGYKRDLRGALFIQWQELNIQGCTESCLRVPVMPHCLAAILLHLKKRWDTSPRAIKYELKKDSPERDWLVPIGEPTTRHFNPNEASTQRTVCCDNLLRDIPSQGGRIVRPPQTVTFRLSKFGRFVTE